MCAHLIGNNAGKGGFPEAGRTVEQDVIQNIASLPGCLYINSKIVFGLFLADLFVEALRPETFFYRFIFLPCLSLYDSFFHKYLNDVLRH